MAEEYRIKKSTLDEIANSTRAKTGKSDSMLVSDISAEIDSIKTQKPEETFAKEYTENGDFPITPSSGKVFSSGTVKVNVPTGGGGFPNGTEWTPSVQVNDAYDFMFCSNGEKVFAIKWTSVSEVYSSIDGKVWTKSTIAGFSGHLAVYSVRYVFGIFVMACNKGIYWSNDFINWNAGLYGDYNYDDIEYGNGMLIAVSTFGDTVYSTDGKNWSLIPGNTIKWRACKYSNGLWHFGGYEQLAYSTDGKTIIQIPSSEEILSDGNVVPLGYFKNLWFATTASHEYLYWSNNGINWTRCNGDVRTTQHIVFEKGIFIVSSGGRGTFWSLDGKTWLKSNNGPYTNNASNLLFSNGVFISTKNYSFDGKTWSNIPNDTRLYRIINFNGILVGGGYFALEGVQSTYLLYSTVWEPSK